MSCKTGLQEGIKKILNDKLWFDYDVQNEIIRIKDTPIKKKGDKEFKKINKKTSIGVAVSTAKDINKTVENLYPGIGDVVKPGRDETYRGAVLIIANTKQYNLINAKNSEEEYKIIEELKKEREEKELAERESFMLKANQAIDEDGNIVPVENLGEIKVPLKGYWESIAEKMQELFPTIKLNVNSSLEGTVLGQANIKAMTVLIDAAFKNKPDLIYHEYAHHYIAWFRNTPLVQEAIKKWGSEEALVQVIGEQSAKQKGKAWKWWQEFKNWMIGLFSDLNNKDKEELKNIITDAFLQGVDLETGQVGISEQRSRELAERASEGVFNQETNQTLTYEQVEKLFDENPEIANQVYEEMGFKDTPDVILPIGTSGSGKSTFIKSLPQENLVVIEPDSMRVEFTGDMNDKSKDKEIYEEAAKRTVAVLKANNPIDVENLSPEERLRYYKILDIKKSDGSEITLKDINENPTLYQLPQNRELEEFVASEKTIRDLAARMSDRIGIPVRFESDRSKQYKGKLENGTAVINLAYATLDTPIHEILGHPIVRTILKSKPELYQNLLKELETGRGKEVFEQVKRDYKYKDLGYEFILEVSDGWAVYKKGGGTPVAYFKTEEEAKDFKNPKYTLEEQQEEAIVELLGLMTAEKLDNVKDGKLISLLKRLLKEMKAFMRSLIGQKEVEIDKLPDNMTINDLADLLAYSNSKLILPGYEVEYTTPDNIKHKTYQEASNHISELSKNVKDVDLSNVELKDPNKVKSIDEIKVDSFAGVFEDFIKVNGNWYNQFTFDPNHDYSKDEIVPDNQIIAQWNARFDDVNEYSITKGGLEGFIEKNKEYEQSKEIIEEWKKVNNIQYNPEEIYSRGQEFSSVVGAYSEFDVNLMMQNLLSHIEDNEKAGGQFAISAYTKPIDKQIGHLEGGGGKIKFKLYPQSNDILWVANTDVYSGSVWDASEKVNKDKKSELLGVSYTKYPSLSNVNTVQPNLAAIVDNLAHHHNELGIVLTGNNFRLEYDEDIPYQTKKIIDGINKILDQKYGKLVKPEIRREGHNIKVYGDETTGYIYHVFDINDNPITDFETRKEAEDYVRINSTVQPTQTNETLKESIESVWDNYNKTKRYKDSGEIGWRVTNNKGESTDIFTDKIKAENQLKLREDELEEGWFLEKVNIPEEKEYTEQALINTKIAALKEVAKKYPRSLIRSEVRPINNSQQNYGFEKDELPFQKLSKSPKEILQEKLNEQVKNNKQVVFDTTNLTKDKRLPFIEAIKKAIPTANIQYKLMELNPELAKQRIKADITAGKNRANVPDATIDRHAESYKQMLEDIKEEPISNYEVSDSQKQQAIEYYIEKQQNQSQKFSLAEKLEAPCEGGPNI